MPSKHGSLWLVLQHDVRPYDIASKRGFTSIMRALQNEDRIAQSNKLKQYEKYIT